MRGSFAVVGRSGGGPHALAVAAELPDRVSCVAALVSLAPSEADNWYEGMGPHNADEYGRADDAEALREHLTRRASEAQDDPQRIIEELVPELSRTDHRVVGDVVFRRLLIETYREGLRQGPAGWIDDVLAFRQPWGIDLSAITAPVLLWHGKQDRFSPFQHTLWLRDRLTGAPDRVELRTPLESGHFAAVEALPDILSWVVEQKETPTPAWSRTPPVDSAIVRGG